MQVYAFSALVTSKPRLTDSAHETKPDCSQAAVSQTEQAFQSKEMLAGPDPPVKKPNNQKKKKKTTPVHFEPSAWNIPLVIGLADVGWVDALAALLLIAVNVGMQIAFQPFSCPSLSWERPSTRMWTAPEYGEGDPYMIASQPPSLA